jgi:hypothetical protein
MGVGETPENLGASEESEEVPRPPAGGFGEAPTESFGPLPAPVVAAPPPPKTGLLTDRSVLLVVGCLLIGCILGLLEPLNP